MLSIIVPTLNESAHIKQTLLQLAPLRARGAEVIVVDGGSADDTIAQARAHADFVVSTAPGRSLQQNRGATLAKGSVLLFLHADSILPSDADLRINEALQKTGRLWGRFDIAIDSDQPALRVVAWFMNNRARITGVATGDQGIFVQHSAWKKVGGFFDLPIMEDVALSKCLKVLSKPVAIDALIFTSARRWKKNGLWRTITLMWALRLAYFLGVPPRKIAEHYPINRD